MIENIASNILDFVSILSRRAKSHNIDVTIHQAKGHELWLWWTEAICHEETEKLEYAKKLARATAAKIAIEAIRRCGPRSVDNPSGFEQMNLEEPASE